MNQQSPRFHNINNQVFHSGLPGAEQMHHSEDIKQENEFNCVVKTVSPQVFPLCVAGEFTQLAKVLS